MAAVYQHHEEFGPIYQPDSDSDEEREAWGEEFATRCRRWLLELDALSRLLTSKGQPKPTRESTPAPTSSASSISGLELDLQPLALKPSLSSPRTTRTDVPSPREEIPTTSHASTAASTAPSSPRSDRNKRLHSSTRASEVGHWRTSNVSSKIASAQSSLGRGAGAQPPVLLAAAALTQQLQTQGRHASAAGAEEPGAADSTTTSSPPGTPRLRSPARVHTPDHAAARGDRQSPVSGQAHGALPADSSQASLGAGDGHAAHGGAQHMHAPGLLSASQLVVPDLSLLDSLGDAGAGTGLGKEAPQGAGGGGQEGGRESGDVQVIRSSSAVDGPGGAVGGDVASPMSGAGDAQPSTAAAAADQNDLQPPVSSRRSLEAPSAPAVVAHVLLAAPPSPDTAQKAQGVTLAAHKPALGAATAGISGGFAASGFAATGFTAAGGATDHKLRPAVAGPEAAEEEMSWEARVRLHEEELRAALDHFLELAGSIDWALDPGRVSYQVWQRVVRSYVLARTSDMLCLLRVTRVSLPGQADGDPSSPTCPGVPRRPGSRPESAGSGILNRAHADGLRHQSVIQLVSMPQNCATPVSAARARAVPPDLVRPMLEQLLAPKGITILQAPSYLSQPGASRPVTGLRRATVGGVSGSSSQLEHGGAMSAAAAALARRSSAAGALGGGSGSFGAGPRVGAIPGATAPTSLEHTNGFVMLLADVLTALLEVATIQPSLLADPLPPAYNLRHADAASSIPPSSPTHSQPSGRPSVPGGSPTARMGSPLKGAGVAGGGAASSPMGGLRGIGATGRMQSSDAQALEQFALTDSPQLLQRMQNRQQQQQQQGQGQQAAPMSPFSYLSTPPTMPPGDELAFSPYAEAAADASMKGGVTTALEGRGAFSVQLVHEAQGTATEPYLAAQAQRIAPGTGGTTVPSAAGTTSRPTASPLPAHLAPPPLQLGQLVAGAAPGPGRGTPSSPLRKSSASPFGKQGSPSPEAPHSPGARLLFSREQGSPSPQLAASQSLGFSQPGSVGGIQSVTSQTGLSTPGRSTAAGGATGTGQPSLMGLPPPVPELPRPYLSRDAALCLLGLLRDLYDVTGRVLPMPPASEAAGIFARAGSSGSGPFAGVGSTHTSFDGSGPAPGAQGAAGDKGSGAGRASEGGAGLAGASAPKFSSAGSLGRSFQGTLAELRSALVALAHETSALGKLVAIYRRSQDLGGLTQQELLPLLEAIVAVAAAAASPDTLPLRNGKLAKKREEGEPRLHTTALTSDVLSFITEELHVLVRPLPSELKSHSKTPHSGLPLYLKARLGVLRHLVECCIILGAAPLSHISTSSSHLASPGALGAEPSASSMATSGRASFRAGSMLRSGSMLHHGGSGKSPRTNRRRDSQTSGLSGPGEHGQGEDGEEEEDAEEGPDDDAPPLTLLVRDLLTACRVFSHFAASDPPFFCRAMDVCLMTMKTVSKRLAIEGYTDLVQEIALMLCEMLFQMTDAMQAAAAKAAADDAQAVEEAEARARAQGLSPFLRLMGGHSYVGMANEGWSERSPFGGKSFAAGRGGVLAAEDSHADAKSMAGVSVDGRSVMYGEGTPGSRYKSRSVRILPPGAELPLHRRHPDRPYGWGAGANAGSGHAAAPDLWAGATAGGQPGSKRRSGGGSTARAGGGTARSGAAGGTASAAGTPRGKEGGGGASILGTPRSVASEGMEALLRDQHTPRRSVGGRNAAAGNTTPGSVLTTPEKGMASGANTPGIGPTPRSPKPSALVVHQAANAHASWASKGADEVRGDHGITGRGELAALWDALGFGPDGRPLHVKEGDKPWPGLAFEHVTHFEEVLREVLRCFCHLLRGYLLPLKWGLVRGRRRPPSAASVHSPSSPFRPDLAHGALSRDATSASHRRPGSAHSSTAAGGSAAGGGPHSPLLRSSATARRPPGSDYLQEGSSTLGGGGGPGGLGTVGSEVDDAESEGMVVERPTLAQLGLRLFRAGYGGPLDEDDTAGEVPAAVMELWDDLLSAGLLASLEALFSLDLMSDVLYDSHLAAVEGGRAAMLRRNAGGSTRVDRVRVLGSRLVRDLFEARPQLAGERQGALALRALRKFVASKAEALPPQASVALAHAVVAGRAGVSNPGARASVNGPNRVSYGGTGSGGDQQPAGTPAAAPSTVGGASTSGAGAAGGAVTTGVLTGFCMSSLVAVANELLPLPRLAAARAAADMAPSLAHNGAWAPNEAKALGAALTLLHTWPPLLLLMRTLLAIVDGDPPPFYGVGQGDSSKNNSGTSPTEAGAHTSHTFEAGGNTSGKRASGQGEVLAGADTHQPGSRQLSSRVTSTREQLASALLTGSIDSRSLLKQASSLSPTAAGAPARSLAHIDTLVSKRAAVGRALGGQSMGGAAAAGGGSIKAGGANGGGGAGNRAASLTKMANSARAVAPLLRLSQSWLQQLYQIVMCYGHVELVQTAMEVALIHGGFIDLLRQLISGTHYTLAARGVLLEEQLALVDSVLYGSTGNTPGSAAAAGTPAWGPGARGGITMRKRRSRATSPAGGMPVARPDSPGADSEASSSAHPHTNARALAGGVGAKSTAVYGRAPSRLALSIGSNASSPAGWPPSAGISPNSPWSAQLFAVDGYDDIQGRLAAHRLDREHGLHGVPLLGLEELVGLVHQLSRPSLALAMACGGVLASLHDAVQSVYLRTAAAVSLGRAVTAAKQGMVGTPAASASDSASPASAGTLAYRPGRSRSPTSMLQPQQQQQQRSSAEQPTVGSQQPGAAGAGTGTGSRAPDPTAAQAAASEGRSLSPPEAYRSLRIQANPTSSNPLDSSGSSEPTPGPTTLSSPSPYARPQQLLSLTSHMSTTGFGIAVPRSCMWMLASASMLKHAACGAALGVCALAEGRIAVGTSVGAAAERYTVQASSMTPGLGTGPGGTVTMLTPRSGRATMESESGGRPPITKANNGPQPVVLISHVRALHIACKATSGSGEELQSALAALPQFLEPATQLRSMQCELMPMAPAAMEEAREAGQEIAASVLAFGDGGGAAAAAANLKRLPTFAGGALGGKSMVRRDSGSLSRGAAEAAAWGPGAQLEGVDEETEEGVDEEEEGEGQEGEGEEGGDGSSQGGSSSSRRRSLSKRSSTSSRAGPGLAGEGSDSRPPALLEGGVEGAEGEEEEGEGAEEGQEEGEEGGDVQEGGEGQQQGEGGTTDQQDAQPGPAPRRAFVNFKRSSAIERSSSLARSGSAIAAAAAQRAVGAAASPGALRGRADPLGSTSFKVNLRQASSRSSTWAAAAAGAVGGEGGGTHGRGAAGAGGGGLGKWASAKSTSSQAAAAAAGFGDPDQQYLGIGGLPWEHHASVICVSSPPDVRWLEHDRLLQQKHQAQVLLSALDATRPRLLALPGPELPSAAPGLFERSALPLVGCCNARCSQRGRGQRESDVALVRCVYCKRVAYCSDTCREEAAPGHRLFCLWHESLLG